MSILYAILNIKIMKGDDYLLGVFDFGSNKSFRLLNINERLNKGEFLNKSHLAIQYNVSEKTIQRDIKDLRNYIAKTQFIGNEVSIKYNKSKNVYYLVKHEQRGLNNKEVLAICKILLESRAFCKNELDSIIEKLLLQVTSKERGLIDKIILNERFHYVPLKHGKNMLNPVWELSQYIAKNEIIDITYKRKDGLLRKHTVKPVAIMFSEYYFYLVAFMADNTKDYPTIFRIDRFDNVKSTKERFVVPYKDKFSDGEFRKRVQFMYSGELHTVKFEYSGLLESLQDRLPTAKIISEEDSVYIISVEVYGTGIKMWLQSQGEKVKVLSDET